MEGIYRNRNGKLLKGIERKLMRGRESENSSRVVEGSVGHDGE